MANCPQHGPTILRNGEPFCIPCAAQAKQQGIDQAPTTQETQTARKSLPSSLPAVAGLTFQEHVSKAVEFLQKAPMPGNMAQFKLVNNAVKSLTKAITPTEEN